MTRRVVALLRTLGLVIASLGCSLAMLWAVLPHATAVEVRNTLRGPTQLPWRFQENGTHRLEITLQGDSIATWNLVPNDKLLQVKVNGEVVSLGRFHRALEDTWNGMELDLSSSLRPGANAIELTVENGSGPGGLVLQPRLGKRVAWLALALVPWLALLAYWFRLDRRQIAICLFILAVIAVYWSKTPWNERQHDVTGHLEYMEYLLHKRVLPPPNGGWAFFHPPLFYLVGALVLATQRALHLVGYETLQSLALVLWLTFLVASAGTLRLVLGGWRLYVATLTLGLWPTAIIHSIRIGNDLMLYACTGVATYFIVRWWQTDRRQHLWLAAFASGLAMLAKTNAIVLVLALGLLFVLRTTRYARWRSRGTWLDAGASALLTLAGVVAAFGNGIWYYHRGKIPNWLVANVGTLPAHLKVPNTIDCYVALDLPTFLTQPWYDSWNEATGRRLFWNALLRTALSGEWRYGGVWQNRIAYAWGVALVGLLLLLVRPAFRLLRAPHRRWREAPWLILGLGWVASLMALRYKAPYSCSNDFRYVLPVLVPFLLATVRTGKLAGALLLGISAASLVFLFLM